MNLNKFLIVTLITICISSHCCADNGGYLKLIFTNKDAVPATQIIVIKGQQNNPSYKLTFTDSNLNKVFNKYKILDFEKEYPIADSFPDDQTPAVRLRLVYKVIIDTTGNSYDELKKSTDSVSSLLINSTVRMLPPVRFITIPNDYYTHYNDSTLWEQAHQHLDLINAVGAWNITTGLSCVKIGIVDEAFQKHDDLNNKVDPSRSYRIIDIPPATPPPPNYHTHGLTVAGMAAAETNNSLGIASLGYNIRLQYYNWTYPGIVNAIYDKCKVVNCSWGQGYSAALQPPSSDVQDVLSLASLNNVTIVAAAGNGMEDTNQPIDPNYYVYPASYDGVISVTAVGCQWNVGDNSHPGNWKDCHRQRFDLTDPHTYQHNNRVDLCAPGYYVETTCDNNTYCEYGGTSLAAPIVSAAAALLYSINPFFTPLQIESYLKNNAANIYSIYDNNTWAGKLGTGRLDAGASLQAAASNTYNGPAYCSSCPTETTYITNSIYTQSPRPSGNFYNYAIVAGSNNGNYVQPDPTIITSLVATSSVILQAGFDANPGNGVYFEAYIEPCTNPSGGREANPTKKT